jgi:hypothetical protein
MSQPQLESMIRSVLIAGGSYAAGRGWITSSQLAWFSSDAALQFVGIVVALGGALWGMIAHKQANMVATVAAMPEVAKVTTVPSPAGDALADAVNVAPPPTAVVVKG